MGLIVASSHYLLSNIPMSYNNHGFVDFCKPFRFHIHGFPPYAVKFYACLCFACWANCH